MSRWTRDPRTGTHCNEAGWLVYEATTDGERAWWIRSPTREAPGPSHGPCRTLGAAIVEADALADDRQPDLFARVEDRP